MKRCSWCKDDPFYVEYHDTEWGVPVFDDNSLFEFLVLEGAQAGLSWLTILRKREGYRSLFAGFDPKRVAKLSDGQLERILRDERIVRNRRKVFSTRANARAFLQVQAEFGTFADYIWGFVDGRPIQNAPRRESDIPAESPLSKTISKDLKKRGFSFVGPTIIYAHMQATGMVNDHVADCFRQHECRLLGEVPNQKERR